MGQSQSLVIAVSVLVIGIAILAGVGYFRSHDVEANKHAMINDVNQIAHLSVRYYSRPLSLQGGGHSFIGFDIPSNSLSNPNGVYSSRAISRTALEIIAVSARDSNNTITAQIGTDGRASMWTFTGDFQ
jgi:hypothetical protein